MFNVVAVAGIYVLVFNKLGLQNSLSQKTKKNWIGAVYGFIMKRSTNQIFLEKWFPRLYNEEGIIIWPIINFSQKVTVHTFIYKISVLLKF